MKQRKLYILIFLLLVATPFYGQKLPDSAIKAYKHYSNKEYDSAMVAIDQSILLPSGSKSDVVWHIRGFIYKDVYANTVSSKNELAREEAVKSFKTSIELDKDHSLDSNNAKALRALAVSYYNDAVELMRELDPLTIDKASDYYHSFKDVMLFLDPNLNFENEDIDFYLAMATCYRKIYTRDRENHEEYLTISNSFFEKVLEIDSTNWSANYSLAVNRYNKGAYNIEDMDEEADIPQIVTVQAESVKSFEKALGPMLKAYEIDPDRIEVLKGLRGIYLSLNDEEKSRFFDEKVQEHTKKD